MATGGKGLRNVLLALAAGAAIAGGAPAARAVTRPQCLVNQIQYDTGRLAIWCQADPAIYYAFTSHASCSTQPLETVKLWLGMLQAALVAGKKVELDFTPPAGSCIDRAVTSVRLLRG